MKKFLPYFFLFFASSYVLLLDALAYSSRGMLKSLVIPIIVLLVIIYRLKVTSWKAFIENHGKWFLLFWGTILVQTLIIGTGGFQSPFLVLLHLFMIGISFVMSFPASVLFLVLSFIVLFIDISLTTNVITYLLTDPSTIVLQLVSLLSIIPLAFILSRQYHLKDMLSTMLKAKVETDNAIFKSINELIIVTDANYKILSVNDAVERALLKPRSELLNLTMFNALLLRDDKGKLIKDANSLHLESVKKTPVKLPHNYKIVQGAVSHKSFSIQVQTTKNTKENDVQYIFVLSFTDDTSREESIGIILDKARVKYEAMVQALKQILQNGQIESALKALFIVEKIENDLYHTQLYATTPFKKSLTNIDIAMLCKNVIDGQKDFANSFQIPITFAFENFGNEDIAPLTVKNYPVTPEQLTGPFFTLPCDVRGSEIVMKKLLDLSVFLASSAPNTTVAVVLKRMKKSIIIQVRTANPNIQEKQLQDLFVANYGVLPSQTNVMAGSGLEGYLIALLAQKMETPVQAKLQEKGKMIVFSWELQKHPAK